MMSVLPASAQPLTRIAAVRALTADQAAESRPVRLRGTITALSGWKNSFFLQDASGAISIDRTDSAEVHPGDEVEVNGASGPGMFAPVVLADRVTVLAKSHEPVAKRSGYFDLASGREDSRWVEVRGVVRDAAVSESWGRNVLFLTLTVDGATIMARVYDFAPGQFKKLVDAKVRVRGVCGSIFNDKRQLMGVRLFVPGLEHIEVEEPARQDPFAAPAVRLNSLFQFAPLDKLEHRVKFIATVTYHDAQNGRLYLQSQGSAAVALSPQQSQLSPGARVEVSGFLEPSQYPPTFRDAVFRQEGQTPPPAPIETRAKDVIQEKDGFPFAPHAGLLVRLDAQLVEKVSHRNEQVWLMRDGEQLFRAAFKPSVDTWRLEDLSEGSRVRLQGICLVESGRNQEPQSFTILLRSDADVVVLAGRSWLDSRALWLVGLLIAACVSILAWALQLRGKDQLFAAGVTQSETAKKLRRMAHLTGWACAVAGLVVILAGWQLGPPPLRATWISRALIKGNAALAAILTGVSLAMSLRSSRSSRWIAATGALFTALIGAVTLATYAFQTDFGIDQLLFLERRGPSLYPGRMASTTAMTFLLIGCSLLLVPYRRWIFTSQVMGLGGAMVCFVNLLGQLYGVNIFGFASHMSVPAGPLAILLSVCLATLLLRSDAGLMAVVISTSPGGEMARRLLPAALLVPLVLGWLRWQGQQQGLYDTAFGLAIYTAANIMVFAFLVWTSAGLLNRSDLRRSQAESDQRETEDRFQTVVESLPQMVWTCGADGLCDFLSRQWPEYTGVPAQDQLGDRWTRQLHPDDRARVQEEWRTAVASGEKFSSEYRLRNAAGDYRWFRALGVPVRDAAGAVTKWFGTSTDIDSLKVLEQALRESESNFRQLADAMPQMVWIALPDGSLQYFNQRWHAYTAASLEEASQWGWQTLIHPDDLQETVEQWTHSLDTGEPFDFEYRMRRASDGAYRWFLGRAVAIRNNGGEIVRWFGTCTDIEDYQRANQELAKQTRAAEGANQAKSDFLARMSHEIRTPMNSILGMADLLWESNLSAEQRQYVEVFRRSGSTLLTLINDILDLSKVEAGRMDLEHIEFDLSDILKESVELVTQKAGAKGIRILSRLFPDVPTSLVGDPLRLRQVLINLLGNAIKFTDAGNIVLAVANSECGSPGRLVFSVSDTGIGIPQDKLETIFGNFTQADSSTTRKYGGTGLGLAISRGIVDAMGGSLMVESKLGLGSTFRFTVQFELGPTLPRRLPSAEQATPAKSTDPGTALSILVADDSPDNRLLVQAYLKGSPHGLTFVEDGKFAVEEFATGHQFHLILMDMQMPRMDGLAATRAIRAIEQERGWNPVPIVAFTANARSEDVQLGQEAGCTGHLSKPISKARLLTAIEENAIPS